MRRLGAGPTVSTLGDLVRWRALRQPDRVGYRFLAEGETESGSLTYGELDRRVGAVAAWLQAERLVGGRLLLIHPPGLDFVIAFLGCLRAGAVAVPAYPPDPARPARTLPPLRAIAEDAGIAAVLTTAEMLALAEPVLGSLPGLRDARWLATDRVPRGVGPTGSAPAVSADSLALLQYTSGSTSAPKGVMLSHRNLLRSSEQIRDRLGHTPDSVGVSWLPPYHDMGLIGGVIQPLYAGFPVVLMSPLAFLERPARWLGAVSAFGATSSAGPNFAYDLCARRVDPAAAAELDLSTWRVAVNGAELVRAETMERFAAAFARAGFRREAFHPAYGLAEATLLVATGSWAGAPGPVACGPPAAGVEVAIVDPETLTVRDPGEVGEVWVSGENVGLGYWNREAESERTFRARVDGAPWTWLRTGDLGLVSHGELSIAGRLKDLLVIRGRNLHPEDVERTVEGCHTSLRRGCGAAFTVDDGGEERLVVVHEVAPGPDLDAAAVLDAIGRAVAQAHEVPVHTAVLLVPRGIPRTANGKVQRAACRAAYLDGRLDLVARRRFTDLRDDVARLLGVDPAHLVDDVPLGALGLDSLGAVELRGWLRARRGVTVPLDRLLHSRVAELGTLGGEPSPPAGRAAVPSLSHGQRAIWLAHQLDPGEGAHNLALAFELAPEVDPAALQRALDALVARHPILRATYPERLDQPVRMTRARASARLWHVDASGLDEAGLRRLLADEAHRPFDLARGPLVRAALCSRPGGEHVLLLAAHHLVMDLRSAAVVLRELDAFHRGVDLPAPAHQHADFVAWQAAMLAGAEGEAHWAYWRERLAGAPPALRLPSDRPRPRVPTHAAVSHRFALEPALVRRLRALAAGEGATLPMALLAGFQVLLHRCGGDEDIVVGCAASGRTRPELADVVGYLVNPLPLRACLAGRPSFRRLLAGARGAMLGGLEHQDFPFPLLVERLGGRRDPALTPLFQAMLVFDAPAPAPPASLGARPLPIERRTVLYDVELTIEPAGDGLAATLAGRRELFERATVERMAGQLVTLLDAEDGGWR